ncbi:acetate--CoA ligase family protein [Bacteroidota bacterium]
MDIGIISFRLVIVFGAGGKYVEFYKDYFIRSTLLSKPDIEEMIYSANVGKIMSGIRGENKIDSFPLKRTIESCSRMLIENENILEFDINPLIVTKENSYNTVDIRIKIN